MWDKLLAFSRKNSFLILLVAMVGLGKILPYREAYQSVFSLSAFIDWGIAGIFLLYGLKLNFKQVIKDIAHWKLHLLVQCATFLLFPVLVLPFYGFVAGTEFFIFWLAVYFLACLPSTVSSSVVMVSIAGGNVTSAIFNASISGLIGIVMTPLLMGFFLHNDAGGGNTAEIVYQLLLKVLLPIVLGLLLNPVFRNWVKKYATLISKFDKLIILLIVYESFSEAFLENVFAAVPPLVFAVLTLSVIVLFFAVFNILKSVAQKMNFSREDAIAITFCGSKKSLVHGSLFVMVLGIPDEQKVIFLLPIMIFHSFQLFYVSWLANRLATRSV